MLRDRVRSAAILVPPLLVALWLDGGWLLLVVWAYDTAGYFAGRRFGERPFMHQISPSKTVEGVVGGLIAAVVVGAVLFVTFGRPFLAGAVLGLFVGAAAQAGDLAESMLK